MFGSGRAGRKAGRQEEESGRRRWKRAESRDHKKHNRQSWTVTRERDRSDRYEQTDVCVQADTQADSDGVIWKPSEADSLSSLFSRHKMLTFIHRLRLPL